MVQGLVIWGNIGDGLRLSAVKNGPNIYKGHNKLEKISKY
jgi:hypothetical protein